MKKTFWYLVFAVIFLPTLGFTAASSFIMGVVGNGNSTIRWECVFLPDSGAFFVNYIITASLMGAGLELIRFPDLVWYAVQICWSKSEADTPAVRQVRSSGHSDLPIVNGTILAILRPSSTNFGLASNTRGP
jgi:hypothetical protein